MLSKTGSSSGDLWKLLFAVVLQNTVGVLENFAELTGKHLCRTLFSNKKRLRQGHFRVNFTKFLRISFFIEHLRWLPKDLYVVNFAAYNLRLHWKLVPSHNFLLICFPTISEMFFRGHQNGCQLMSLVPGMKYQFKDDIEPLEQRS